MFKSFTDWLGKQDFVSLCIAVFALLCMLLVLLGVCADTYVKIKRLEVEREAIEHGIPITITPEKP